MILNDIEIMFGGQAGDGSLTTGDLIAGVFKRMGLEVYTYKDFPSRIRGGHTNYVIRAGEDAELGHGRRRRRPGRLRPRSGRKLHIEEMRPGGFVIFDNTSETDPDRLSPHRRDWYEIPLAEDRERRAGLGNRAQHDLARRARRS